MRLAIIDLGTNSVRFDVHQVLPRKRVNSPLNRGKKARVRLRPSVKLLHREKMMVRLGQEVFTTGRLHPQAIQRTLQAFKSFRMTINDLHVDQVIAFGTSALREASDGQNLLKQIEDETGISLRIISGNEEAKLIAHGILSNERLPKGTFALLDIGGGSTEVTICRGSEILHSSSFPLGTARLQQMFGQRSKSPESHQGPHSSEQLKLLRRYIRSILLTKTLSEEWPKSKIVLGSSGTVKSVLKLSRLKSSKKPVTKKQLEEIVKRISSLSTDQLLDIEEIEAKRVDMIVTGAVLLEEALKVLGANQLRFTEFSLRDGILEEEVARVQKQVESKLSLHLDDLRNRVKSIHKAPEHSLKVEENAAALFRLFQPIHRLNDSWLPYLQAAALYHDMGELISSTKHEDHSYYFAKNSNIIALESWENEFIARMCLFHRAGKLNLKGLKDESAFAILVSLLRMADALDRSHEGNLVPKKLVQTQSITTDGKSKRIKRFQLVVACPKNADLEALRFEQKKALFEELFSIQLSLKIRK